MIVQQKQAKFPRVHHNTAINHARKSLHKKTSINSHPNGPSYETKSVIGGIKSKKDHVIGGNVHIVQSVRSVENDETDVEHSGYSMIDSETFPTDDDTLMKLADTDYRKDMHNNRFTKKMTLFLSADHGVYGKEPGQKLKVHVGKSRTEPFARDNRKRLYPKDRGKLNLVNRKRGYHGDSKHSNKKHSKVSDCMICMNDVSLWLDTQLLTVYY